MGFLVGRRGYCLVQQGDGLLVVLVVNLLEGAVVGTTLISFENGGTLRLQLLDGGDGGLVVLGGEIDRER